MSARPSTRSTRRGYRSLLTELDDNPLTGVANLFDVAMVFAVAILIALVSHLDSPSAPDVEAVELQRFEQSTETGSGEGVQLGMAYRLDSGEVVYVPNE